MQKRIIQVGLAGMNQDVINPKVNTQYAYEIKNFRINSTGHSNGIELTSENGTKLIKLKFEQTHDISSELYNVEYDSIGDMLHEYLIPQPNGHLTWWPFLAYDTFETVGYCVLNEYITLFVHATKSTDESLKRDCILRLRYDDNDSDSLFCKPIYYGDLGFDVQHRIECVPYMESVDIQKIYFIDGINYPRVINIKRQYQFQALIDGSITYVNEDGYLDYSIDEDPFSFYQKIASGGYNTIDVTKTYVGGLFYAGVVQYAFSFYNKNAQETPIIYTTPLNYISHSDRGEAPNKQLGCAFNVTVNINQEDQNNFEYVRVYSIYRSSINGTLVVKVIKDAKCEDFTNNTTYYSITFTDTNEQGYDFDAYRILINSDNIIPNAIAQKDAKLFFGNYISDNHLVSSSKVFEDMEHQEFNITFMVDPITIDSQTGIESEGVKRFFYKDPNKEQYYNYVNQLKYDSMKIKGFKWNQRYKLGLQFQDRYGHWSSPFYIATKRVNVKPLMGDYTVSLPYAKSTQPDTQQVFSVQEFFNILNNYQNQDGEYVYKDKFVNLRPVVSLPNVNERDVLCQGIISPTVFNISERQNGNIKSQSSWFFRPFVGNIDGNPVVNDENGYKYLDGSTEIIKGANVSFEHYEPLSGSDKVDCEIQGMYFDSTKRQKRRANTITAEQASNEYQNYYYVDQSIGTINSPDIEFNDQIANVDLSQYKLRIIGCFIFGRNRSKYEVVAESPLFLNDFKKQDDSFIRGTNLAKGFFDHSWQYDYGRIVAQPCWFDDMNSIYKGQSIWNQDKIQVPYMVYPWNREYINNYNYGQASSIISGDEDLFDTQSSSKIIRKILGNIKYSEKTSYIDSVYNIETSDIKLFQDTDKTIKLNDSFYSGNIDQLFYNNSVYLGDKIGNIDPIGYEWPQVQTDVNGYPIVVGNRTYDFYTYDTATDYSKPTLMSEFCSDNDFIIGNTSTNAPIRITYKSARHIAFDLAMYDGKKYILPYKLSEEILDDSYLSQNYITTDKLDDIYSMYSLGHDKEILLIGELYKEDNSYATDTSEFFLKSRTWLPCGRTYNIDVNASDDVKWLEGDTYFQRYDSLKTYPNSNDDMQSIIDIASVMLETYINIDGRYDENRGLTDNTFVNPTNFNLINPVYSQTNNFFQYNILDEEDFKTTDFPTRFTWSLNKINGQDIDEWTRTNTVAFYDCDGDKGELTSLRRFNGQIYAFQEKGISRIKYNENVAINTNNGTPIELANSQSVNGVEYISELVGSQNKWSNISTPDGIFFTDNYTAGLYRLGGGERILTNLTKNVLQRWFESNNTNHDFIDTASYDANMNEVHFMFDNQSLAYNNDFGTFSSFYDYKGWIGNSIYFLREGNKYNSFYGTKKPYWISFVANSNIDGYSPSDAIYDNVWYKADVLHSTKNDNFNYDELIQNTDDVIPDFSKDTGWYETFNKIVVGNDYQYAENKNQTKNFDFIKKFRTWRVPVPRQDRARMRNSWLRIRLENTKPSYDKMVLRDIYVDSFF